MIISVYAIPGKKYTEPLPASLLGRNPYSVSMVIKSVVIAYFQADPKKVFSKTREREHLLPRQVMHYLAKKYTSLTLKQIGSEFPGGDNLDHSTIKNSIKAVLDLMDTDEAFKNDILQIEQYMSLEEDDRNLIKLKIAGGRPGNLERKKYPELPTPKIITLSEHEKVLTKYL